MYNGKITAYRDNGSSVDLMVHVDDSNVAEDLKHAKISTVIIDFKNTRIITISQRKKIYATLNDIALYTGYLPEETKEVMKYYYIRKLGGRYFSLSDCSVDTARAFINVLTDFCLENGVIVSEGLLERTDDIYTYLYQCIRHRKCAICGKLGEIHHWDAIGMGNNRNTYDDSANRKICLCRMHHTIAHQKGVKDFQRDYHVYGITYQEGSDEKEFNDIGV